LNNFRSPVLNLAATLLVASLAIGCSDMAKQENLMAPGVPFKDCPECPQMAIVPAGSFVMGSPSGETGRRPVEGPQREVTIEQDFAVGIHEVTLGEFIVFVRETDRDMSDARECFEEHSFAVPDNHPVACVNWQDASDYAQWLTERTGKPYRLLTEAEWEYTARAGSTSARFWGRGASAACKFAQASWCGALETAPVGQFQPNAIGSYDMMGNVWEWVEDCWHDNYIDAPADGSAWTTGNCKQRVLRGGSFYNKARNMRSATRSWNNTNYRYDDIGFRLARSLP
jgi:formylglycine-generating enzyme required for sulfatase activity